MYKSQQFILYPEFSQKIKQIAKWWFSLITPSNRCINPTYEDKAVWKYSDYLLNILIIQKSWNFGAIGVWFLYTKIEDWLFLLKTEAYLTLNLNKTL